MQDFADFSDQTLKEQILQMTAEYSRRCHQQNRPADDAVTAKFVAGETTIPYAGRVFDEQEVVAAVDSTLDFWLTLGREGEKFESGLADYLGVRRSLLVNSGSSANLVALSALTSHKLPKEKRIMPGDEVITVAAGFPTTVSPIIQCGARAVFIDADPVTGNPECEQLESAYRPGKTKAVMFAHALGNPFDLSATIQFCRQHDLWLIEDNCDALGCEYSVPDDSPVQSMDPKAVRDDSGRLSKPTGSWGDLSTQSFYPPHHLTLGEGGAVNVVRQPALKVLVESFRDWGRDCWCPSGKDDTCNKRFAWQLGELPEGYDHKYIYSHLGYNLKPLDIQAAIGVQQLAKLDRFVQARKDNWQRLRAGLADLEDVIEFSLPTHATRWNSDGSFDWDSTGCRTECSWFGFKMSVRDGAPFGRTDLARHLDQAKIGNRMLFGGNLVRQPAFVALRRDNPDAFRVIGDLTGADAIMNQTVFIGTFPGLTGPMIDYIIDSIQQFVKSARRRPLRQTAA
ncbi:MULTISPECIES: lipopolysaccharide biosynthesis protein RfbH [Crateriforma]|uniref:dTDP-4-amino-4,6-dideoxy-D-glucose transaminase n=1 Tax=Crateriforma conspicua TaxID=2527996 RepID=A0A5C6FQ27_9PLAN|nr:MULTISPECIES: lipopolysaccharide biosynthesis protein RfbH [Crateriforma]QDV61219.1 dTDP-4-amino-4,6-dideoxy-D-glucose transaminase [Crateriforma conspicua]TWU63394.1 dTDP-4-amino-4,6-dideoxy-D-glucose transaminase [Crateriforma conspicua]